LRAVLCFLLSGLSIGLIPHILGVAFTGSIIHELLPYLANSVSGWFGMGEVFNVSVIGGVGAAIANITVPLIAAIGSAFVWLGGGVTVLHRHNAAMQISENPEQLARIDVTGNVADRTGLALLNDISKLNGAGYFRFAELDNDTGELVFNNAPKTGSTPKSRVEFVPYVKRPMYPFVTAVVTAVVFPALFVGLFSNVVGLLLAAVGAVGGYFVGRIITPSFIQYAARPRITAANPNLLVSSAGTEILELLKLRKEELRIHANYFTDGEIKTPLTRIIFAIERIIKEVSEKPDLGKLFSELAKFQLTGANNLLDEYKELNFSQRDAPETRRVYKKLCALIQKMATSTETQLHDLSSQRRLAMEAEITALERSLGVDEIKIEHP
jgi:hypothetical protein